MQPAAQDGFRPEVEGLRGVAVLLVLVFHAGAAGLPGGFTGVDVFFVISGFLITGLLLRERERTGTVGLRAFYARRVRRLLPAGLLALAVTAAVSWVVLSPLDREAAALDAVAAALSVGNLRFAVVAGDYFASVGAPSPFLHFWSLGVEEQFYLCWPALVLLAARGRRPRLGLGILLGSVVVLSFVGNVLLTAASAGWAFYLLPARAWQLALGGLLAVGTGPLARVPGRLLAVAGWAGTAALAGGAVLLDGSMPWPGALALVPTVGAAAVLAAGGARGGPVVLLGLAPLRFLGRISYSLYLWHWPVLVLPAVALEAEAPPAARVALAGLAIVLAWASFRLVEEPFRRGFPVLARNPGRTVLAGGLAVVLVAGGSWGLALAADAGLGVPAAAAAAGTPEPVPVATPGPTPGRTLPATGPGPAPATPVPTASPPPVTYGALPAGIRPALADARADEERLRADGCLAFEPVRRPPRCTYGDPGGTFVVALVGDSHAAHWFPALEAVARARGWRVETFVKVACPFLDMPLGNLLLKREYVECAAFRDATLARLAELRPDLVLVGGSRMAVHPLRAEDEPLAARAAALARTLDRMPGRVALLVDTPDAGRDVPACLARHRGDAGACAVERDVALARDQGRLEELAAAATGAGLVDLTARVCRGWPCPVAVDGLIVFRDARHLTATFSRSLAPDLAAALDAVLAPRAVDPRT